jgi:hypothetical protein
MTFERMFLSQFKSWRYWLSVVIGAIAILLLGWLLMVWK